MRRHRIGKISSALAISALVSAGTVAAAQPASAATWYCKVVVAADVSVYTSPSSNSFWGTWQRGHKFFTDRKDGSKQRYHTYWDNGHDGWVTSSARWVQPC
jgi:hypothetical protein